MSKKIDNTIIFKFKNDLKKSSKFIKESLIVYSDDNESCEFFELMKNGYKEMSKINLEIAGCGGSSQKSLKYKFDDINEYEKWLCGVWYFNDYYGCKNEGDIFYADLSPVIGSEQGGIRPVIIIQNDIGNKYSPTVIVAAITSQINKAKLPTHVEISSEEYGLNRDSVVLLEQIRTLDKKRLKEKIGHMTETDMKKVDKSLLISISLA